MIANDALAGLGAGQITEAEALEQTGAQDIDGIYERAVAGGASRRDDRRPERQITG